MARFRGDILQNDQVLYEDLEIQLIERSGIPGFPSKSGLFMVPVGEEPALGEEFTLKLSDGRSLQIITKSLKKPGLKGGPSKIEFIGTGPISS